MISRDIFAFQVIRRARHLRRKLKQITNLVSIFNMNCTEFASVLYPQFRRLYQVVQMMIKGFQSYGEQNSVFRGQISLKRRGYKSDTGPCSTAIVPTLENTCCVCTCRIFSTISTRPVIFQSFLLSIAQKLDTLLHFKR